MIDSKKISAWISSPVKLEETTPKEINELIKEYPFFQIGHYLKYLQQPSNDSAWFYIHQIFEVNPVLMDRLKKPFESREFIENDQSEKDNIVEEAAPEAEVDFKEEQSSKVEQPKKETLKQENPFEFGTTADYFSEEQNPLNFNLSDLANDFKKSNEEVKVAANNFGSDKELDTDKSLIVVMTFSEWLKYLQERTQKAKEEQEGQKALRAMWQRQKLAEALEDEDEEIPEQVFNMAVNSITLEEEIVSESLAEVYIKQGKKKQAIEMFKKLSLRNPEKSVYFAHKIETLQKEIDI